MSTQSNLKRWTIENGIPTIRPVNKNTGKVMGTPAERAASIAACQKILDNLYPRKNADNFEFHSYSNPLDSCLE